MAARTTERARLQTLASGGRLLDKTAFGHLSDTVAWINGAKQAVVKAMVLAARNTRLGSAPVRRSAHLAGLPQVLFGLTALLAPQPPPSLLFCARWWICGRAGGGGVDTASTCVWL